MAKRTVKQLSSYLQVRGVTHTGAKKAKLEELVDLSQQMNLQIVRTPDQTESDRDKDRRTVILNGKLSTLPCPQDLNEWSADLSGIPFINMGTLIMYLMNKCGWKEQCIREYHKSQGYQLHENNHIHGVTSHEITEGFIYIKAGCVRQTSLGAAPYSVWALLHTAGDIISGGCECTGDDGQCKHVVALLFGLVAFLNVINKKGSCTSEPCVWKVPRKTSEPIEISKIDINLRPETRRIIPNGPNYFSPCGAPAVPYEYIVQDIYESFADTDAVINHILGESSDEESDQVVIGQPNMLHFATNYRVKNVSSSFIDYLQDACIPELIEEVELDTRQQNSSLDSVWQHQRIGRITSSLAHNTLNFRGDTPGKTLLETIMGSKPNITTAAMDYGKSTESTVRELYRTNYKSAHVKSSVTKCGLIISSDMPYTAASPDAKVKCQCCGHGLLEIKCTYKYRNISPLDICSKGYHVFEQNGEVKLKKSSCWWTQIQHQLLVSGYKWCDFVLYTQKSPYIAIHRIMADKAWQVQASQKYETFFTSFIQPRILEK